MSQMLPVNNVEAVDDTSQFNEELIKSYDEGKCKAYFPEVDVQYT